MGRDHAPSKARALAGAAKEGGDTTRLADEARAIDDPYHSAWALFHLVPHHPELRAEALARFDQVEATWRRAELAGEIASILKDDETSVMETARRVILLPPGKARSQALQKLAKRLMGPSLVQLLAAAVQDPENAVDDGKTILRAWSENMGGDPTPILEASSPDTRARLFSYLHLQSAKTGRPLVPRTFENALDAAQQAEDRLGQLRYLATVSQNRDELQAVVRSETSNGPRLRLLQKAIAQADRLGDKEQAGRLLEEARSLNRKTPDEKTREKIQANLEKAEAKLKGIETPAATPGTKRPRPTASGVADIPRPSGPRPVIGLHNGYTGELTTPHKRAVARAAPLCAAFGLDLLLIGFPAPDAKRLVEQVELDTRIGEGAAYARMLLEQGRLLWAGAKDHTTPGRWPVRGETVATTPHPDPKKKRDLRDLDRVPVLVVGLGPQGLPRRLLDETPHHLELTGHDVSLETATALGVLAERLRHWQPQDHRRPGGPPKRTGMKNDQKPRPGGPAKGPRRDPGREPRRDRAGPGTTSQGRHSSRPPHQKRRGEGAKRR